jgi:hypothetical protein
MLMKLTTAGGPHRKQIWSMWACTYKYHLTPLLGKMAFSSPFPINEAF